MCALWVACTCIGREARLDRMSHRAALIKKGGSDMGDLVQRPLIGGACGSAGAAVLNWWLAATFGGRVRPQPPNLAVGYTPNRQTWRLGAKMGQKNPAKKPG